MYIRHCIHTAGRYLSDVISKGFLVLYVVYVKWDSKTKHTKTAVRLELKC